jgi:hypothetical protein
VLNDYQLKLMYRETGVIKIADFGLSKSVKLGKTAGRRESLDSGSNSGSGAGGAGGDSAKSTSFKMTGETGSYRCGPAAASSPAPRSGAAGRAGLALCPRCPPLIPPKPEALPNP